MDSEVLKIIGSMDLENPANIEKIVSVEKQLDIQFDQEYKEFLLHFNGAEGSIGKTAYLALWKIEELVELNDIYGSEEFTPGLIYFGTDGGEMAYAFDKYDNGSICEYPLNSVEVEDKMKLAESFQEFLKYLYEME